MVRFNEAIQKEDFADFYNSISAARRAQVSAGQLQAAFQGFIDQRLNLGIVATLDPVFDGPPQIDQEGLLLVSGSFATQARLIFSMKFIAEAQKWSLFDMRVNVVK